MATLPHRFTEKAIGGIRHQPTIEKSLDGAQLAEFETLLAKHQWESWDRLEDELFEVIDSLNEEDVTASGEIALTGGLYLALVRVIADVRTHVSALGEFQLIRRRELEARIDALEAKPIPQYRGIFSKLVTYPIGTFITHNGSIWHANSEARGVVPGDGSGIWTLACKRGHDGKDLRR